MTSERRNEGIIVSGGTLSADVLAVGRCAQAIKNVTASADALEAAGSTDVARCLQALVEAITAHAQDLEAPAELAESTELVANELTSAQPNRLTLRALLDGLVRAAGSVTAVAHAAGALQAAVMAIV
jgi:translation initiation factor 2B subunit (eIF-2B alpha/beta/delta family)